MNHSKNVLDSDTVTVLNPEGQCSVVVVCEHASCFIPPAFNDLGLSEDALQSHAAWDPGALAVAQGLSQRLGATLVASNVSRLVYDCNRPPSAVDAMPQKSEAIVVPGNANLTPEQRSERAGKYYEPFRATLAGVITTKSAPVLVTVHSFTPIYYGQQRAVEIGILHDTDARLAQAMMDIAPSYIQNKVELNQPYGPEDGVTHTLKEHALDAGYLNVMLEIRNDLIQSAQDQDTMATRIAAWVAEALVSLQGGTQ